MRDDFGRMKEGEGKRGSSTTDSAGLGGRRCGRTGIDVGVDVCCFFQEKNLSNLFSRGICVVEGIVEEDGTAIADINASLCCEKRRLQRENRKDGDTCEMSSRGR